MELNRREENVIRVVGQRRVRRVPLTWWDRHVPREITLIIQIGISIFFLGLIVTFGVRKAYYYSQTKSKDFVTDEKTSQDEVFPLSPYPTIEHVEDVETYGTVFVAKDIKKGTPATYKADDEGIPDYDKLFRNKTNIGLHTRAGLKTDVMTQLSSPFIHELFPNYTDMSDLLRPIYHMHGSRTNVDIVIGLFFANDILNILSKLVQIITLMNSNTLVVVLIDEPDLEIILTFANDIELLFAKQVKSGLIEILSPTSKFYSSHNAKKTDINRAKWMTRHNLIALYLMSYAKSKGNFYLALESGTYLRDDFLQTLNQYVATTTSLNPQSFSKEYCQVGGIGKLYRTNDIVKFLTTPPFFFDDVPVEWLLETYLAFNSCSVTWPMRIKFKTVPVFHPHKNPALREIKTDITEYPNHTLAMAYEGQSFFWGHKPKAGNVIEFIFKYPTAIERFTFRSGNLEHMFDKFYHAIVDILPINDANYLMVTRFDRHGVAHAVVPERHKVIQAIRLHVKSDSLYWIILSEIELKIRTSNVVRMSTIKPDWKKILD